MATGSFDLRPPLPPYQQLILEAIDELKQKEGANKSAISKYIESNLSKNGDLPADHADLLSTTLSTMKEKGQLIFFKNNYLRPDPNNPVRRGRGRPPKPKDPLAPSVVAAPAGPSKGRGRPKKDPNASPAPKKPKLAPSTEAPPPAVSRTGQPRGRPRKVKPQPMHNCVGIEGM